MNCLIFMEGKQLANADMRNIVYTCSVTCVYHIVSDLLVYFTNNICERSEWGLLCRTEVEGQPWSRRQSTNLEQQTGPIDHTCSCTRSTYLWPRKKRT